MSSLKKILAWAIVLATLAACSPKPDYSALRQALSDFASAQDARIGIAVIIDGKDTVTVNGNEHFPMLSVYKLPIALALADSYRRNGLDFDRLIPITAEDLLPDTYSPMTDSLLACSAAQPDNVWIPTRVILQYMLQQSDNNASDIALRQLGGPQKVMDYLGSIGATGINVLSTEAQMHQSTSLCYLNSATPLAMARLIDRFQQNDNDSLSMEIKRILENCGTGTERLAKPLSARNITIGHKTGTGFPLPAGGIMAVNDAGYVVLPDGKRYTIAVFIADSQGDIASTERIIAEISQMVVSSLER